MVHRGGVREVEKVPRTGDDVIGLDALHGDQAIAIAVDVMEEADIAGREVATEGGGTPRLGGRGVCGRTR